MSKIKNMSSSELKAYRTKISFERETLINKLEVLRMEENYFVPDEQKILKKIDTLSTELDEIDNILGGNEYV